MITTPEFTHEIHLRHLSMYYAVALNLQVVTQFGDCRKSLIQAAIQYLISILLKRKMIGIAVPKTLIKSCLAVGIANDGTAIARIAVCTPSSFL